ncbi:MAG: hypothetical protein ACRDHF_07960 [Tepidiformaceae bacterium]
MRDGTPFLLVRARPKDEARAPFRAWFLGAHLKDVRSIPGIAGVESGETAGGTTLGFYSFEDAEAVQTALSSPQAAYSRGTWEQWAGRLEELLIEVWADVPSMPVYRGRN